jgi:flagellar biosynthesis/type III secretory pathway M-ring protein FliF/YscJ
MEAIEAVAKQAMGFDEKRGDRLTVRCVPFFAPAVENDAEVPPPTVERVREIAKQWAIPATSSVVVLLAFSAFVLSMRARRKALPALLPSGPRTLREIEAMTATQTQTSTQTTVSVDQVQQAVLGDGDRAASVVRAWLGDGKNKDAKVARET